MTRVLSGIRPTGKLHLGNYIGAVLPAIKYDADVLIAEYHAPDGNAKELDSELRQYISPDKIVLQSEVFDPRLYFRLLQITPSGLLNHMPQYKATDKKTAHMFVYPVLMAHDLIGYDEVVVGEDQRPHIEFANDILHKIGEKCPVARYDGGKVMDLRNPDVKMSKSSPETCLFMSDRAEVKRRKLTKAVTTPDGRKNLEFICRSLGLEVPESNSDLKDVIYDRVVLWK